MLHVWEEKLGCVDFVSDIDVLLYVEQERRWFMTKMKCRNK